MIDIKSKSEIIIPFEKIGNDNWTENTKLIITNLAENWDDEPAISISTKEIEELEDRLKTEQH